MIEGEKVMGSGPDLLRSLAAEPRGSLQKIWPLPITFFLWIMRMNTYVRMHIHMHVHMDLHMHMHMHMTIHMHMHFLNHQKLVHIRSELRYVESPWAQHFTVKPSFA